MPRRRRRCISAAAALLKAMGLGSMLAPALASGLGAALAGPPALAADADPSAGLYPFKRNPRYTLDRPITAPKYSENYNNFYEFGSDKAIADDAQQLQDPAVDGQDRRHGRKADRDRHRRSLEEDAARGAALPPSLRRGVVDGGAVERLCDGRLRRFRQAARLGQIRADEDLPRPRRGARARSSSGIRGPMSKG